MRGLDGASEDATVRYQELTSANRDAAYKAFRLRVQRIAEAAALTLPKLGMP